MAASGIYLSCEQIEAIFQHARSEYPNEACGLLGGVDGRVYRVYPMLSTRPSPVEYEVEPQALLEAILDMEDRGWEPAPMGIYHSHPRSEAYPSSTDVALAFYPDSFYVIVSLACVDRPVVRAFRIVDKRVTEEQVIVE